MLYNLFTRFQVKHEGFDYIAKGADTYLPIDDFCWPHLYDAINLEAEDSPS